PTKSRPTRSRVAEPTRNPAAGRLGYTAKEPWVSAPNEPGHPGKAESPGSGSAEAAGQRPAGRPGRITDTGEAPPWQRGAKTRQPGPARTAEPPRPAEPNPP